MRKLLVFLLFPVAAFAETTVGIAKAPWGQVVIYDSPCTNAAVLKMLPAGASNIFKRAHVQHDGKGYAACWTEVSPDALYLIDESGDQGPISKRAFVKPTGA